MLMKNFGGERPLISTLNKYVKVIRTEHCFRLFEELGKTDKWLQCLEVCVLTLCLSPIFFLHFSVLGFSDFLFFWWGLWPLVGFCSWVCLPFSFALMDLLELFKPF